MVLVIVSYCADCGNEQHYRPECCDNWDGCDCPRIWECKDTSCRCVEDGDLVVCGSCAGSRSVEVTLTGDYSTETFILTVTKAQEQILRTLAERAEESMRASSPITVRHAAERLVTA